MAEVMALGRSKAEEEADGSSDTPIMPHRIYSSKELDELYPSLEAVDSLDDEVPDQDQLLAHGLKIAEGIAHNATFVGRKRVEKA